MFPALSTQALLRVSAALASAGAAVVHAAVVPGHWATWWVSGLFFVVLAAVQLVWAAAVLRFSAHPLLWAGVLINAGSAVLWGLTRVAGQPVGPQAGTPLPVGPAGLLVLALELLVCASVLLLFMRRRHTHWRGTSAAAALGGATAVVVALTVPGVAAALQHDHAEHAGGHGHGSAHGHGTGGGGQQEQDTDSPDSPSNAKTKPDGGHGRAAPHDPSESVEPKGRKSPDGHVGDGHAEDGHSH